ncbi:MAG: hypothetical protein ACKOZT_15625 [Cyanobium sp.]
MSNSIRAYLSRRWEPIFFIVVALLLLAQVYLFVSSELSVFTSTSGAAADYARLEGFIANHLAYWVSPVIFLPLFYLLACRRRPSWTRHFLDGVGIYIVVRMFVQVIGLNLLVFDSVTPRFTLITQLVFFLPYSLLVWGWIYWRLDELWGEDDRRLFQIDCEQAPYQRPIDYLVASLSSAFSASISGIKGRSARAKLLLLVHGFFVYDLMGLTLSRAVALIQSK